ncbi:hypothetical protein FQZ97_1119380 [compost metagenome]
MRDALHVLLDDRTLVQIGSHEVGSGTDELHATLMGLVIGTSALEAGEEAVVDVDATAFQLARKVIGQDLHVASEYHQVGFRGLHQGEQLVLLLLLGLRSNREVVECDALEIDCRIAFLRMVGYYRGDLHRQLANAAAIEQIAQAMIEA